MMKIDIASKSKINWLSVLQGWSMLLVVVGHAGLSKVARNPDEPIISTVEYVIYSFHMPLFMMISGYLFYLTRIAKPVVYSKILKNKFIRLGIPYVVFTCVTLCLKVVFNEQMVRKTAFDFKEFINAFLYPGNNPLGELWFIATLLVIFIFSPFLKLGLRTPLLSVISVGILLLLHLFPGQLTLFCLSLVASYAIWFFIGLVIARYDWVACFNNWWVLLGTGIVFVGCFIGSHYYDIKEVGFILTLSGCIFSYSLALVLNRFLPALFHTFRNYTFQIYLLGIFFQIVFKLIYQHLFYPQYYLISFLLCILSGLYMPVLIARVVEKLNCRFLSLVIGLNVKNNK